MESCSTSPCNGRFYFAVHNATQPFTEQAFAQKVVKIDDTLKTLVETQSSIASKIHSYSCPWQDISKTHQEWKKELAVIHSGVRTCAQEADLLGAAFISLPSLKSIHFCLKQHVALELRIETIQTALRKLNSLLDDTEYAKMVALYKRTIKIYEGSEDGELQTISQELPIVVSSRINQELLEFYQYACKSGSHEKIDAQIDDMITPRLAELTLNTAQHETCHKQILLYIANGKEKDVENLLRKDLLPYNGFWGSFEDLWTDNSVSFCIKDMKVIAFKLQQLQASLQVTLEEHYRSNTDFSAAHLRVTCCKISLEIIKEELKRARVRLYTLPSAKQICTGLHYASRLSAFTEELEALLTHFSTTTNEENRQGSLALHHTFRLISLLRAEDSEPLARIEALFFAALHVANVLKLTDKGFNRKIALCLCDVLARTGRHVLTKMVGEDVYWLRIVSGTCVQFDSMEEWDSLVSYLTQYVERQVTEWLYFSTKETNIQLDMVIYSLKHDRFTSDMVSTVLSKNESFKKIFESYHYTCDMYIVHLLCTLFRMIQACDEEEVLFFSGSTSDAHAASLALITEIEELRLRGDVGLNEEVEQVLALAKTRIEEVLNK
ncbi:MAG: hypothetical protein JSR46_05620 [Verrucomicrobia bacterium]|nr:hypothetical protein [Verrucomicrobiota bacterium]